MGAPGQFAKLFRGWRNTLRKVIPAWQQERPGAVVGFRFLWSLILPIDILIEQTLQGVNAWGPGSPNATPTALALLGQSRGLIQGEVEADEVFAARLRNWRTNGLVNAPPLVPKVGSQIGNTLVLAQQIQVFLANNPTVRIFERIFTTSPTTPVALVTSVFPDGTTEVQQMTWEWDTAAPYTDEAGTHTVATIRGWWSDFWVIVTPATYAVTGTTLAALVPIWGTSSGVGIGHAVPRRSVDAILRLVAQFKGAYTYCRGIVWSYDSTLFDPGNPSAPGNPDGTWGMWIKDNGSGGATTARPNSCRFWIPRKG
jgi:hypothetical protein